MTWLSAASGAKVMVVKGTVRPDSTLSSTAGWPVTVYSYQEPPPEMPHLPPTGHKISETTCDTQGRYEFQLNVDDLLAQRMTRIVVFAHPNPSGGLGWKALEIKEGVYEVNLMASNLPALPSVTTSTVSIPLSTSSTSAQSTIPSFPIEVIVLGLMMAAFMLAINRFRRQK